MRNRRPVLLARLQAMPMEEREDGNTKIYTRRTGGDRPEASRPGNSLLGDVDI